MDRGAWQVTVRGVTKSWTQLSDFHFPFFILHCRQILCLATQEPQRCIFCCSVTQSCLTLCDPHGLQYARLLCPSPSPWTCSNQTCPLCQWSYLTISPSATPFSFQVRFFHSLFSPSSRGCLVPLHFLPLEWCHVHIWDCCYLFLPEILIPACDSSSVAFCIMFSTKKLNKQGDNIQPSHAPFPILNQSVVLCLVLTVLMINWLKMYEACRRVLTVLAQNKH